MKKIYLGVFALSVLTFNSTAQKAIENYQFSTTPASQNTAPTATPKDVGAEVWSNDFDNPADWTIANDAQTGATFGWNIDATSDSWYFNGGINSTSGGNFAEVGNGDPTTTPGTQAIGVTYTLTTAASIDIPNLPLNTTNTDDAVLQFEEYGASFYDNQEVQISTDGVTFTTVRDNSDYAILSVASPDNAYANPETVSVNISPYIDGNASTVWIRFSWTSQFPADVSENVWVAYGWYIDDVKILTQPVDDVQILNSYFVGTNNEGIEYGRTPVSNLDASYVIGSTVYNFGSANQPNTDLSVDFGSFNASATNLVQSDSTEQVETTETPALPVGVYTGAYSVEASTDIVGGVSGADNVDSRTFEVTNNVYSMDGIGVYPSTNLSSLGTDSFTDAEDGLIIAAMYHIKANTVVNDLQVMLATGTVPGGQIFGSIIDTTVLLNDGTTPLFVADPVDVTAADISAGYILIPFTGGVTLTPGAYYAAVELTSNSGANTIRISDDETVAQPSIASMIYIPADRSYTNGTAAGIRMITDALSVTENTLDGVSVYPNPSKGMITISNDNNTTNTIAIYNVLGKEVFTTTANKSTSVDLSANGSGVYLVKVSNANGSSVERVVIK
ncbi:MAG: T9SS type A sorting domain-containing protein [Flavobacteriales bacterium]|nr:T9SS type A sorting domain-containing protein [Flavobacteriales bacterium]